MFCALDVNIYLLKYTLFYYKFVLFLFYILIRALMYIWKLCVDVLIPINFILGELSRQNISYERGYYRTIE